MQEQTLPGGWKSQSAFLPDEILLTAGAVFHLSWQLWQVGVGLTQQACLKGLSNRTCESDGQWHL